MHESITRELPAVLPAGVFRRVSEAPTGSNERRDWLRRTAYVMIEVHGTEASRVVHEVCAGAGLRFIQQHRSTRVFSR
jgi:hypothetical protein